MEVNFETQTLEGFMVRKGIFEGLGRSSGGTLTPYGIIKVIGDKVILTSDFQE